MSIEQTSFVTYSVLTIVFSV